VLVQDRNKERVQTYQGVLISKRRAGGSSTFTLRRAFSGFGIERTFFVCSALIAYIEVVRLSKVRRAKLYYLRTLKGKIVRLRERFTNLNRKSLYFKYIL
jgi:large subunit ribosomal protein L19